MAVVQTEYCVVGGGIAGLCTARALARAGARVTVVEKGEAGRGAGFASAGMLAPIVEAHLEERGVLEFNLEALAYYEGFVADLQNDTGIDVDLRKDGTLIVAVDRDHAEWLRHRFREYMRLELAVDWLSGYEVRQAEPYLAPGVHGALVSLSDQQVNNRLLLGALVAFARDSSQIDLYENAGVGAFGFEGGCASVFRAGDLEVRAETFIVATGADLSLLRDELPHIARLVRPVKGQIIRLDQSNMRIVDRLIRTPDIYLAPKSDGTLVIGASSEEKGFDESITAGEIYQLLRRAWEVLPAIYELPVVEINVGFRPAAVDHAPVLGQTPVSNLHLVSGFFRHGILMSPYAGEIMADALVRGRASRWLEAFSSERHHDRRTERTEG